MTGPVRPAADTTRRAARRAAWQRRGARRLADLLEEHRDLPVISWTVCDHRPRLLGRVGSLGSGEQVQAVFERWWSALGMTDWREYPSGLGTVVLHAATRLGRVRIELVATIDEGEA